MLRPLNEKRVRSALSKISDPLSSADIVSAGLVESVVITKGNVAIVLSIDPGQVKAMEKVAHECERAVLELSGVKTARVALTAHRDAPASGPAPAPAAGPAASPAPGEPVAKPRPPAAVPIDGVRRIVAVASGKGGVGKSTTAVNLALALRDRGLSVGVLDADIYGPSIPRMLGGGERPELTGDDRIVPVVRHGVKSISIGHLVPEDRATIWRGPMVIGAMKKLLGGVAWNEGGDVDVLVVDLPPGTGDAQLSLMQTVPVDGAVLVSTPQDIALIDARKAYDMFDQIGVPVLGMVENMSQFVCPHCGEATDVFGHGGAVAAAKEKQIAVLGEVPLNRAIMQQAEDGVPIVTSEPQGDIAGIYRTIAGKVMESLELQGSG
jgi:ATP-binding protein involved in chromosome partitioning